MHWVELQVARAGGWVTYVWEKITRALGDVTVLACWLDPTVACVYRGEGGVAH